MTSTLDNALFLSRDDCLIAITQCLLAFMERNLLHNLIKLFHVFCRLLHFRSPYFESDDVVQVIFSKGNLFLSMDCFNGNNLNKRYCASVRLVLPTIFNGK